MNIRERNADDIRKVFNLYLNDDNKIEKACWTE